MRFFPAVSTSQARLHTASRRGVALVVVLSVIVLAAVLVLSFLSVSSFELDSSSAYARSLVADQMGRGAIEEVVDSLREEARQATAASTDTNRLGLLPIRYGVTEMNPRISSLVRRSANLADADFTSLYTAGGVSTAPWNYASPVSTGTPSVDGRRLSLARWQAPKLLAPSASVPLPDWIYVTRQGPKKVSNADVNALRDLKDVNNLDAVVGRYAYTVYDTSGLLDVNVAGTPVQHDLVGQKGSTALADLLPVFQSFGGSAGALDSLLSWRNPTTSSFLTDVYGTDPTPGALGSPGRLEKGFAEVATGSNAFMSRSELLKYAADHPSVLPTAGLPFFSTFSRASLRPEIDAATPGRTGYLATSSEMTIPYYTLEGEPESYTIKAGHPFLQRKFPLSRLRWFNAKSAEGKPTSAVAAAIKQHFGLTWVDDFASAGVTAPEFAGKGGYLYTSPAGNAAVASIKTLNQVVAESREPDFFEWLKAAINPDSLGITAGNGNTLHAATQDASRDFQIIQIGANIMDQSDADDVPTLIASRSAANRKGEPLVAFGVESLPYINEIMVSWHRPKDELNRLNGYLGFELWNPHQNAARPPRDHSGAEISGNRFRIRVVEGRPWVSPRLRIINDSNQVLTSVETAGYNKRTIVPKTFTGDLAEDTVSFAYTEADFSEPRLLGAAAAEEMIGQDSRPVQMGVPPKEEGYKGILMGGSVAPEPVFSIGEVIFVSGVSTVIQNPSVPGLSYGAGEKYYTGAMLYFTNSGVVNPPAQQPEPLTLVAEVQLSDGTWVPYQTIESWNKGSDSREYPSGKEPRHYGADGNSPRLNWEPSAWMGAGNSNDWTTWNWSNPGNSGPQGPYSTILTGNVTGRAYRGWENFNYHNGLLKVDPRTRRFGLAEAKRRASPGASLRESATLFDRTTDTDFPATTLSNWTKTANDLSELGRNAGSSTMRYTDHDGVLRPGDWVDLPIGATPTIPAQTAARPVVLNRPFRSVAELGYAFRDLPWKTLDFFSQESADLALMDVFSVEAGEVSAGKVNLNTVRAEVLEAILSGAANNSAAHSISSAGVVDDAEGIADALITAISASDAAAVRRSSEGLKRLVEEGAYRAVPNKIHREAYARGLAGSTDAGTWNLMIDLIAQAGRLTSQATTLEQFKVTGERRYWAHVAIDRATGDVIDLQLEPVYE